MMSDMPNRALRIGLLFALAPFVRADDIYRKPPAEVLSVLTAPATPQAVVSPDRKAMLLARPILYPPVADLARPMARLAGVRIDIQNNGPHNILLFSELELRSLSSGASQKIALPAGAEVTLPEWSSDGRRFAFARMTKDAVELWTGDAATGQVKRVEGVRVNAALSGPRRMNAVEWMPDGQTLLVQTVPQTRGSAPAEATLAPGPHTQESAGKSGPAPTFEDLLKNSHDEELFDYYATAQLEFIDAASGKKTPYGSPAIFDSVEPSPDGKSVLVARVRKPYSYFHPVESFAKEVEVWDRAGRMTYKVASLPVADRVPIEGVPTGPREYQWVPTQPATLLWVEAMDGGNPKEKVPHRDRIMMADPANATREPRELVKVEERFSGIEFGESGKVTLYTDYERTKRWVRTFALDPSQSGEQAKLVWSRNIQDRYKDPGTPVMQELPNGKFVMRQDGDAIFLRGLGATPKGDRPFLTRFDIASSQTEELFRSDGQHYEAVEAMLSPDGKNLLVRRESPTEPPNFFVRQSGGVEKQITDFRDPAPELRKITKQLVTYKRADGVPLSFTLYLPPDYKAGTRLPTIVWAYPFEYTDAGTAGQISGSTQRFTTVTGASEIFFALEGYAVLDNAAMPVIGDPETVNNTYLDQIVMDAKAAIDKAVEMGVTDRDRVGVGGHSYGAFMTANLMAHSDLFKAGIARSGAYNRTLTPFGFQSEHRTLWEAPDVYLRMSPFLAAEKIKGALLLIHGEADDNTGTFPIQSERMYAALRGNGATVRLVTLPYEAHGYRGLESIEHVLYEMIAWSNKYVKDAGNAAQSASVR